MFANNRGCEAKRQVHLAAQTQPAARAAMEVRAIRGLERITHLAAAVGAQLRRGAGALGGRRRRHGVLAAHAKAVPRLRHHEVDKVACTRRGVLERAGRRAQGVRRCGEEREPAHTATGVSAHVGSRGKACALTVGRGGPGRKGEQDAAREHDGRHAARAPLAARDVAEGAPQQHARHDACMVCAAPSHAL